MGEEAAQPGGVWECGTCTGRVIQHAALCSRLSGHINYFGVNGNSYALARVVSAVTRAWHKWLNRRSQRRSMDWEQFKGLLKNLPLPQARITVQIWV